MTVSDIQWPPKSGALQTLRETEKQVIRKNGFVAMLDILGFSDQITRDSEVPGLDKYIDTVVTITTAFDQLKVILFSDTVALYSVDETEMNLEEIVRACSRLMYSLLMKDIPLRGAIGHGTFVRSDDAPHGVMLAGRPIIDAHWYESQQQWVGVMLTPSVLRKFPSLMEDLPKLEHPKFNEREQDYIGRMSLAARLQRYGQIPLQDRTGFRSEFDGYAVIPTTQDSDRPEDTIRGLPMFIDRLRWLKQLAPDYKAQTKYANSIRWLETIASDWSAPYGTGLPKLSLKTEFSGDQIILSIMNEGSGPARAPHLQFRVPPPFQPAHYGLDGNGNTGLQQMPQPPNSDAHLFADPSAIIHAGASLGVTCIGYLGPPSEKPKTVRIEYELRAENAEEVSGSIAQLFS